MTRRWFPLLLMLAACGGGATEQDAPATVAGSAKPVVYTVNHPLAYFAERVGAERVQVEFPAPPGIDPAFWSPSAEIVAGYQSADLVLLNGARYARWVERVSLPTSRLVDTSASLRASYLTVDDDVTHTHGPQGAHSHGELAFTTWLDPRQAVEQARAVELALESLLPQQIPELQQAFEALEKDLLSIDAALERTVSADPDRPLLASHPVYQYLQRRYGMNLVSLHWEPDVSPDEVAWAALGRELERRPASWMIWEAAPLQATRERLEQLGVGSVVFAPGANRPAEGDFLGLMGQNIEALRRVYGE